MDYERGNNQSEGLFKDKLDAVYGTIAFILLSEIIPGWKKESIGCPGRAILDFSLAPEEFNAESV